MMFEASTLIAEVSDQEDSVRNTQKINWIEMLKLNFSFDYLVFIDFNLVFTHSMSATQVKNDLGQTLKSLKKTFESKIFFYLNPNSRDI